MTRRLSMLVLAAVATFCFAPQARAQVTVQVTLPTITFSAPPPLVVVSPGIQVVPDYGEEVFFVSGVYWVRQGGKWFRSPRHDGGWVLVSRGVPPGLVRLKPGKYKHFRAAPVVVAPSRGGHGPGKGKAKGHGKGR